VPSGLQRKTSGPEERDKPPKCALASPFVGKMERLEHRFFFALWAGSFITGARNRRLGHDAKGVASRLLHDGRLDFAVGELMIAVRAPHNPSGHSLALPPLAIRCLVE
jgi:hypothetical protein